MITKTVGVDYLVGEVFGYTAVTLCQSDVDSESSLDSGYSERTHPDGWTIKGFVHGEYCYTWVNEVFGRVWGNFETCVYADLEEGYQNFLETHPYYVWDYLDI